MHTTPVHVLRPVATAGLALAALATAGAAYAAPAPHNEQVVLANVTNAQTEGVKSSINGTAQVSSADGRFVVFSTTAPLVSRDHNETDDVYLRDTVDGITILVSSKGTRIGNDSSFEPTISNDGRFVAFTTLATNLFPDTNTDGLDVAVKDMQTGKVVVASVDSHGKQRNQNSFFPVLSGNGHRVSIQSFGRLGPKDGDKLEDVYVRDLVHQWTRQASVDGRGRDLPVSLGNGDISDNGNLVTFGDANDLWVHDVQSGKTTKFWHERNSPPCQGFPIGSAGRPVLSGDGKYVAFSSCATTIPIHDGPRGQVYRMDLATREFTLVSHAGSTGGNAESFLPSLSRTGRYVGFGSDASDLVAGDDGVNTDAFVADLKTGTIRRASQAPDGSNGNSWSASTGAAISGDGHTLVYESYADNLVDGDLSNYEEVFAWRG